MWLGGLLRPGFLRPTTKRARRILIASAITLFTSLLLLGLIATIRWGGRSALQSDTHSVVEQTSLQLLRTLQSRRGTLTLLRDTLNRRTDLSLPQLQAMGASATEHTRHMLGIGVLRAEQPPVWWREPQRLGEASKTSMNRAITQRGRLRGVWRSPSTFVVSAQANRPLLVMFEPLKAQAYGRSALISVFDLKPLLEDFFASALSQPYPVQVLDRSTVLYRSPQWRSAETDAARVAKGIVVEHPVALDAARWTLQMQPGSTRTVQALSRFHILLIVLSVLAGAGITVIVWILAARTWLLQRAVSRRTAALRRVSERLRHMATTDELTGLHNRRFFLNRWELECDRAKRYQRPLACLMIDVNNFKHVNDRLGHHAGDLVLQHVASELKTMLRQSDLLARFGGDEFIVALPETTPEQAESVAEKLRQIRVPISSRAGRTLPEVSLSVGLGRIEPGHETPQSILEAADQSLYASKQHRLLPS